MNLILGAIFACAVLLSPLQSIAGLPASHIGAGPVEVTCEDGNSTFTITYHRAGGDCICKGSSSVKGDAGVTTPYNPLYGSGAAIVITDKIGQSAHIEVYPRLPFVFLYETLRNSGAQDQLLDKVSIVTFTPNLQNLSQLKIRGTGGLTSGDHPDSGSYEWMAIANPESRSGIVAGWVTQFKATGVLVAHVANDQLSVEARSEYGHLRIRPGETVQSETLALGYFDDVRLGLESWADQVAKTYHVKLPPQPAGYCTWYADQHGASCDEKNLGALGDFAGANLKPYGMSFVQIDDGWQMGDSKGNGPHKNFTDYNPSGPYPSGLRATADHLAKDGLICGLWFMPFAGTYNDPWFKDKQDLFVRHQNGAPYDTDWGGTCLDMTNPVAQDYLRKIVTHLVQDWGIKYVKMDGFWTGSGSPQIYVNDAYKDVGGADAVFSDPYKTNVEALRIGIKIARDAAGPGVFFLGCNVAQNMRAFGGSFGTLDAMRIGPDNTGTFDGAIVSARYGSRNYFLNGRVWYNDPDPCYVRASMTLDEARFSASWAAISGQLYTNSDWIPALPPERLEIIKRTILPHGKTARPVDFLENDITQIWQVIDDKSPTRRDVVALYNTSGNPATISTPLIKLQLPPGDEFAAFDFWANAFLPPVKDTLTSTLPPHSCQIIALRPMQDHPFVLSTSRHVTQGMTDLSNETWNSASNVLSGTSQVIAGDPYEIRVIIPPKFQAWTASQATVDPSSNATITVSNDRGCRATISSSTTGPVAWYILFSPQ